MNPPTEVLVSAAWEVVAADFMLVDSEPVDDESLAELRTQAAETFAPMVAAEAVARFDLPSDYQHFLRLTGGSRRRGDLDGYHLFGPSSVISETRYANELFADDAVTAAERVAWLVVAHWSDTHDIVMCCDRGADVGFGTVMDFHDGHPWLGENREDDSWPSFSEYLTSLAAEYIGPQEP